MLLVIIPSVSVEEGVSWSVYISALAKAALSRSTSELLEFHGELDERECRESPLFRGSRTGMDLKYSSALVSSSVIVSNSCQIIS